MIPQENTRKLLSSLDSENTYNRRLYVQASVKTHLPWLTHSEPINVKGVFFFLQWLKTSWVKREHWAAGVVLRVSDIRLLTAWGYSRALDQTERRSLTFKPCLGSSVSLLLFFGPTAPVIYQPHIFLSSYCLFIRLRGLYINILNAKSAFVQSLQAWNSINWERLGQCKFKTKSHSGDQSPDWGYRGHNLPTTGPWPPPQELQTGKERWEALTIHPPR